MRAAKHLAQGQLLEAESAEQAAADLRGRAMEIARNAAAHATQSVSDSPVMTSQSDRLAVAEALGEIDAIASPRLVADYVAARFNKIVATKSFASIRRDERKAWNRSRGSRSIFIVPALDGGQFIPARGMLALSTWESWRRIIGPRTGRVELLRAARSVLAQWEWLQGGTDEAAAARMQRLLVQLIHSVPGATAGWRITSADQVHEAVERELTLLNKEDEDWRHKAAKRAESQLSSIDLLWGAEPLHAVEARVVGGGQ
jgi:hypothetical protein